MYNNLHQNNSLCFGPRLVIDRPFTMNQLSQIPKRTDSVFCSQCSCCVWTELMAKVSRFPFVPAPPTLNLRVEPAPFCPPSCCFEVVSQMLHAFFLPFRWMRSMTRGTPVFSHALKCHKRGGFLWVTETPGPLRRPKDAMTSCLCLSSFPPCSFLCVVSYLTCLWSTVLAILFVLLACMRTHLAFLIPQEGGAPRKVTFKCNSPGFRLRWKGYSFVFLIAVQNGAKNSIAYLYFKRKRLVPRYRTFFTWSWSSLGQSALFVVGRMISIFQVWVTHICKIPA